MRTELIGAARGIPLVDVEIIEKSQKGPPTRLIKQAESLFNILSAKQSNQDRVLVQIEHDKYRVYSAR